MDVWLGTILAIIVFFFYRRIDGRYAAQARTHIESDRRRRSSTEAASRTLCRKRVCLGCLELRCWRRCVDLATAYSIREALGFEKGFPQFSRGRFHGVFTFLVAVGAAIAVIPNLPLIRVLLVTQVINGLLLPIILFAILRLVNDRDLMGSHVNGPLYNIGAWLTAITVTVLSLLFILVTIFPHLFRF